MTTTKIPTSTARVETQRAGNEAVSQKLISQSDLDALLKNPVLSTAERAHAKRVVGELRGLIEAGHLTKSAQGAAGAFIGKLETESSASERIACSRAALAAGVISASLFEKLTGGNVAMRPRIEVLKLLTTAQKEVDHLTPIVAGASGPAKAELQARLGAANTKLTHLTEIAKNIDGKLEDAVRQAGNLAGNLTAATILVLGLVTMAVGLSGVHADNWQAYYIMTFAGLFGGLIGAVVGAEAASKLTRVLAGG